MPIDLQELLRFVKSASAPQSQGNQAMAAAAQMAAPPGAPPMPKAIETPPPADAQPAQPQGEDPIKVQQDLAKKDEEISKLQSQIQEAKLEATKAEMKAELQTSQQQILERVRKEQTALDKKQTEFAAAEERHRAQLELDTARQQADIAKAEAAAEVNIARRDADSMKQTADANAKAYVKMTDDARKAADKQMADRQKASPFVPVSLRTQLDSALAAAHNVGKLRLRLSKQASTPGQQPGVPQNPSEPPAANTQPQQQAAPQQPSTSQPAVNPPAQSQPQAQQQSAQQPQPQQQAAPQPQPQAQQQPTQQPTQQPAQRSDQAAANAAFSDNQYVQQKANEQIEADHKLSRIGDKVSMQGNALQRHKEILTAEAQLNRLRQDPNADPFQVRNWQEAVDTAKKAREGYMTSLQERASKGDPAAQEELIQMTDFQQKRETANTSTVLRWLNPVTGAVAAVGAAARGLGFDGVANTMDELSTFGASDRKSEEQEYIEAAAQGMTPEEYQAQKGNGFTRFVDDWINPFDDIGKSINDWQRARQIAANRGMTLNWFDDDYEGEQGRYLNDALQQRNLNATIAGNAGNVALNTGLAALDTLGTVGMVTGVGAFAGGALRAASGAARAARAASNAYKLSQPITRAAMTAYKGGARDAARRMLRTPGVNRVMRGVRKWDKTPLGRIDGTTGLGLMAMDMAPLVGQATGTNIPHWVSPHALVESNRGYSQAGQPMLVSADGRIRDAGGNMLGYAENAYGQPLDMSDYQQMVPDYQNLMLNPGAAGAAAGANPGVKSASYYGPRSWATDYARQQYMQTPYNTSWIGKAVGFASPHISALTGGMIQLAPTVTLPVPGSLAGWNANTALSDTMTQSTNPLFNPSAGNRGLVDALVAMRKQTLAHPQNVRPDLVPNAPMYHTAQFA